MPKLKTPQQEALAHGVANGLNFNQVARQAGYAKKNLSRLKKYWSDKPEFVARVAEINASAEADVSDDLRPVIRELMAAARKAVALESGVGMRAAATMYAEAARLKQALGAQYEEPELYPAMSREEWLATFAPPAPPAAPA